jgi:hypothetical protein
MIVKMFIPSKINLKIIFFLVSEVPRVFLFLLFSVKYISQPITRSCKRFIFHSVNLHCLKQEVIQGWVFYQAHKSFVCLTNLACTKKHVQRAFFKLERKMPRTANQNRYQKTTHRAYHRVLVCHVIFSPDRECHGNNFLRFTKSLIRSVYWRKCSVIYSSDL